MIEVTSVVEKKRQALLAHKSQFDPKMVESILSDYKKDKKFFEAGKFLKLAW